MALETGLSFEAENADQFLRALDDGADAVGRFESASESAEKGIDVFGEIAVGALRSIGETAIEWIGSAVEVIGQAVDSVISFGKESLLGAAEDEQAFVKMQQALKRLGDQAPVTEEQALALAESYKMLADGSADTIVGVEEQILKFPELSGRFEELIPIVLDFAALTGQKATSAAFQLSRSLADPERAIRVLRQAGIILNDQEREQIKTFMEMGDTASAQGLIIDKLKDKTGGMAEALAGTAKQQWALFTMTIAEAGETIMGKFLPVLEDLYNKYIKPNLPLIDQFASSIGEIIDLLITGDFKGGIFGLMEDDPWIAALFNARNAVMGLVDWVGKLIPWLMDFWKNNIQSSIPAITQWASLLGEKIPGYLAMFKDLLEKARPSIERMLEAGQKLFDAFLAS